MLKFDVDCSINLSFESKSGFKGLEKARVSIKTALYLKTTCILNERFYKACLSQPKKIYFTSLPVN